MSRYTDTYSLLLYLDGTFKNQSTGLTFSDALRWGHEAIAVGRASRIEVWNEYHDRLEYEAGS